MSPKDSDCNEKKKEIWFLCMRGTHTFGYQGEQGRISRVNGAKAVKQHEKDFSLQEKGGQ